jgi:hypothetical protein
MAAGGQDFANIGDAVLNAALARRNERIVGDLNAVGLNIVGGGIERMLECDDPQIGGVERGHAVVEASPSAI